MSKIICDVCGTAYPETAAQCPICGSAKNANAKTVNNTAAAGAAEYQYVKGGRFSKKNVKKRNKENQAKVAASKQNPMPENESEDNGVNKGLVILLLIVIAAVLAMTIYIGLKFFMPSPNTPDTTPATTTEPSISGTTEPSGTTQPTEPIVTEDPGVPCVGIKLQSPKITLDEVGATAKINVTTSPADTTDTVIFTSSNESVVVVDAYGYVTAVGHGNAMVTVQCGDFSVRCQINVTAPATEPSTEPTEPSVDPELTVELNREDISMFSEGEIWRLYIGSAPMDQVTFSSDDETVATFVNGTVTAVAPGITTVHAEYNGVKVSCIIRCNWEAEASDDPTEPELEEGVYSLYIDGSLPSAQWGADVSLGIGESFELTLVSPSGKTVNVTWTSADNDLVEIDGNTITGAAAGNTTVSVEFYGQTYTCIVRVR